MEVWWTRSDSFNEQEKKGQGSLFLVHYTLIDPVNLTESLYKCQEAFGVHTPSFPLLFTYCAPTAPSQQTHSRAPSPICRDSPWFWWQICGKTGEGKQISSAEGSPWGITASTGVREKLCVSVWGQLSAAILPSSDLCKLPWQNSTTHPIKRCRVNCQCWPADSVETSWKEMILF